MNIVLKEERLNMEMSMDLALEKFFDSVLECIDFEDDTIKI